jgi:hypothetical protein
MTILQQGVGPQARDRFKVRQSSEYPWAIHGKCTIGVTMSSQKVSRSDDDFHARKLINALQNPQRILSLGTRYLRPRENATCLQAIGPGPFAVRDG